MAGADTVRGIAYQQWHAVCEAVGILDSPNAVALRVEGMDDIVDIEILDENLDVLRALQIRSRTAPGTWGRAELVAVLKRWAGVPATAGARFDFVTNARLGPTGELVRHVLELSRSGSAGPLAELLDIDPASPVCECLRRAFVRQDAALAGELAGRTVRDVIAMLPAARTAQDAENDAETRVFRLFQALLDRAGRPNPPDRIMMRSEIAQILGVPADQRRSQQWQALRGRYVEAARGWHPPAGSRPVREVDRLIAIDGDRTDQEVTALLAGHSSVLAGRTGSGNSTAVAQLVRSTAAKGRVVIPAAAEAYVAGRLAALVADSVASLLDEPVPVSTGLQILADRGATLIIDGASEISGAARDRLREELLAPLSAGTGASVVVVGRDVAALRALFPTTLAVPVFTLRDLDAQRRTAIVAGILEHAADRRRQFGVTSHPTAGLVAQVESVLGDAGGNPMLFTMAAEMIVAGVEFTNVTELYRSFVEQLAERTNTNNIAIVARGLGVAFADLLDDERRSADPYTWAVKMENAAAALRPLETDAGTLDRGARQAGLVCPVGISQVVVPVHDSFADYLAATAHADGLSALPPEFQASDQQRLLFSNAIHPLAPQTLVQVARDLPLLTPRLALDPAPEPDAHAPSLAQQILAALLPPGEPTMVSLWRIPDGRSVAFRGSTDSSGWLDEREGRDLFTRHGSIVSNGGTLGVAVGLWRQFLRHRLARPGGLPSASPRTVPDAVDALTRHLHERAARARELVSRTFTDPAAAAVLARLSPLGLEARISARITDAIEAYFPVTYRPAVTTDVRPEESSEAGHRPVMVGESSVEHLLSESPRGDATHLVVKAINDLADVPTGWL